MIIKTKWRTYLPSDTRKTNTRTDDTIAHESRVITGTNIIKCNKLKIIDSTNVFLDNSNYF